MRTIALAAAAMMGGAALAAAPPELLGTPGDWLVIESSTHQGRVCSMSSGGLSIWADASRDGLGVVWATIARPQGSGEDPQRAELRADGVTVWEGGVVPGPSTISVRADAMPVLTALVGTRTWQVLLDGEEAGHGGTEASFEASMMLVDCAMRDMTEED